MIKKTLILTCILLAAHIIHRDYFKPDSRISMGQWQDNQIIAQEYLYSNTPPTNNIIVGSSVSKWIYTDSLDNFTNLAFSGESAFEGLELISHRKEQPKNVFIELNLILKNNPNFNKTLYNPFFYEIRKYIPALRDGRQPLSTLKELLLKYGIKYNIPPHQFQSFPLFDTTKTPNIEQIKEGLRIEKREQYANMPRATNEEEQIAVTRLKNHINILESKGVNIILFEVPTGEAYCSSARSTGLREIILKEFPMSKYTYFPFIECGEYKTSDELHLTPKEALRYTLHFRDQYNRLKESNKANCITDK